MLTIHVWPRWVKEFLLTHPLYKSPDEISQTEATDGGNKVVFRRFEIHCGESAAGPIAQSRQFDTSFFPALPTLCNLTD